MSGDIIDADAFAGMELAAKDSVLEDLISLFRQIRSVEGGVRRINYVDIAGPECGGHRREVPLRTGPWRASLWLQGEAKTVRLRRLKFHM
jgi:hypothetical protein